MEGGGQLLKKDAL